MSRWPEMTLAGVAAVLLVVALWQAFPGAAAPQGLPLHRWVFALIGGVAFALAAVVTAVLRSQRTRMDEAQSNKPDRNES